MPECKIHGKTNFRLPKSRILSKNVSFFNILRNSTEINGHYIKLYYNIYRNKSNKNNTNPPSQLKVGFFVSKKFVKKAVKRNKIKRYLREIFRKSEFNTNISEYGLSDLIIMLNQNGYSLFNSKNNKIYSSLNFDFTSILEKLKKNFSSSKQ